jgi:phosphoglucosamine mutase
VRTQVGDRYVVEEMLRGGYNFGGEQSGHMVFLDYNTTGDGILSALQLLAILRRQARPLSELAAVMERVPQVLVNVRVARKVPLGELPEVSAAVRRIETALGEEGRLLVRYSGTENLVRVMVEGPDEGRIRGFADELAAQLKAALA